MHNHTHRCWIAELVNECDSSVVRFVLSDKILQLKYMHLILK